MSKFYSEIAKFYDYIFPTGNAQINLIKELAGKPPKEILDAACGSGGYSKRLSDEGFIITAIDLDEAMVNSLRGKDSSIDARVLNILEIKSLNKVFDLIFCIGNSLVHLNSLDEIEVFLKACRDCIKPHGKVLLQIVNYDRILAQNIKSLPTIKNEEVGITFERHYEYLPDQHKIDFKTILKTGREELENHQMLFPVKSEELVGSLKNSGFSSIKLYGSFMKEKYDPMNSFPLIVVAGL